MKKLIIAAVIAVGLGFGYNSNAAESILSMPQPVEESDITQNILDWYVPLDLDIVDTLSIKQSTKPGYVDQIETQDERDYFYAFGVPINFGDII